MKNKPLIFLFAFLFMISLLFLWLLPRIQTGYKCPANPEGDWSHSLESRVSGEYADTFSIANNHPYYAISIENTSPFPLLVKVERNRGRKLENSYYVPAHSQNTTGFLADHYLGSPGQARRITIEGTQGADAEGKVKVETRDAPIFH